MTHARGLMLVSARVDEALRSEVAQRIRPRPEYLLLEKSHGVDLLDWSRVPGANGEGGRSRVRSAAHVAAALRQARRYSVILSDGEHVGIPLAWALRGLGIATPHLVIGHHLTTPAKAPLMRHLGAHEGMSRVVLHSRMQMELVERNLGVPAAKLAFVPYYADTAFWSPADLLEERLVLSAGREHRDYVTLASACADLDVRVVVAAGSVHSPGSTVRAPAGWPANFELKFAGYTALRELYARASVVVVPLVNTDFQAGVTTMLEAMAMGKAVVATATSGQSGVVRHEVTGLCVPPNDPEAMKAAITRLLDSPAERRRLGSSAREAVLADHSVEGYARQLAEHMEDLASSRLAVA